MFRKMFLGALSLLMVLAAGTLILNGCGKKGERIFDTPSTPTPLHYEISVDQPEGSVGPLAVSVVFADDPDTVFLLESGVTRTNFETRKQPLLVIAAGFGRTGYAEVTPEKFAISISLEVVRPPAGERPPLASAAGVYWFGVYDTDANGDVRFRYQYTFSHLYCSSWLPGWPYGDPNPNHWTSWNISDFPPPWKGKRLLVPRRYQWWHQAVYGYSINRALFLIAI